MSFDKIPEFLKPRLRIFLSVDLIGSTSFKQSGHFPIKVPKDDAKFDDIGATWFSGIASFYRDVDKHFSETWTLTSTAYLKPLEQKQLQSPALWKSNGDELIYTAEILDVQDILIYLAAWIKALKQYRSELKESRPSLDIKLAAWIAGFPIGNAEVIFIESVEHVDRQLDDEDPRILHYYLLEKWYGSENNRTGLIKDYIGPSMDTGFRIASKATSRKFMLSLELAMIVDQLTLQNNFEEEITFHCSKDLQLGYDGREPMKGVLGGNPYPLFWIDFLYDSPLIEAEDKLRPPTKKEGDGHFVYKFANEFIREHEGYLFSPFVLDCGHKFFKTPPENYEKHLCKLHDLWNAEKDRLKTRFDFGMEEMPHEEGVSVEIKNADKKEISEFVDQVPQRDP